MSQDASTLLLAHHLKALKLPTFLRDYTSVAATCSQERSSYLRIAADLGYANGQYLMGMVLKEAAERDISMAYNVGAMFFRNESDAARVGYNETQKISNHLRVMEFKMKESKRNLQIIRAHAQILTAEFSEHRRRQDAFQAYCADLTVAAASRRAALLHYEEAYKWFTLSAAQGHQVASIARDNLVREKQLPQDLVARAQKAAASFIPLDRPDIPTLERKAIEGDTEAQYRLAYCLFRGLGVQRDEKQFASWCQKAAINGHVRAQLLWGASQIPIAGRKADIIDLAILIGIDDEGGTPTHPLKAEEFEPLKWILLATLAGDSQARDLYTNLWPSLRVTDLSEVQRRATLWRSAPVVEATKRQAKEKLDKKLFELRSKRANEGFADAQYDLANQLINGDGIPKDEQKGREWLERAAAQGHAKAKSTLKSLPSPTPTP